MSARTRQKRPTIEPVHPNELPTSIVIGGKKWTIKVDPRLGARVVDPWFLKECNNIKRGETIWGLTIPRLRLILISESCDLEERWKILLHELLHACFPLHRVSHAREESIVYGLTPRIVEVFAQLIPHVNADRARRDAENACACGDPGCTTPVRSARR